MKKILQHLIIILLFCIATSSVYAQTYYVSTSGSNSNSGSENSPWATPGYGSRQLSAGDTLIIKGGTYYLSQYDDDIIMPSSGKKRIGLLSREKRITGQY